jgi:hypothetical protein
VKNQTTKTLKLGCCLMLGAAPLLGMEVGELPGSILLDGRIRYESADQTGLQRSDALTGRLRFGYELVTDEGFSFLAEGEGTMALNSGDYDPYPGPQGNPGKTVIADPQNLELNRLQIGWKGENISLVAGRQRIIRNNARFVGNVGWRQNEQTFDAAAIDFEPAENITLYYAYLDKAKRIFGARANNPVQREFDMQSHILEAQYAATKDIKAGAYAYLLEMNNSAGASSDSFGAWVDGKSVIDEELTFLWRGEFAQQSDNGGSAPTSNFSLGYYHLTAGLKKAGLGTFSVGYEVLEGDGARGFSTPLATLHAYNGFADVFLSTPADGLKDLYAKAVIPLNESLKAVVILHDFRSENASGRIGREYDFVLGYKINKNLSATGKLAFYDGTSNGSGTSSGDVTKFWIQIDAKY